MSSAGVRAGPKTAMWPIWRDFLSRSGLISGVRAGFARFRLDLGDRQQVAARRLSHYNDRQASLVTHTVVHRLGSRFRPASMPRVRPEPPEREPPPDRNKPARGPKEYRKELPNLRAAPSFYYSRQALKPPRACRCVMPRCRSGAVSIASSARRRSVSVSQSTPVA